jgi:chloride channel 7
LVAGSGIPEVKGYLNGVRVVNLINLKTFIGKIISIIFAYGSSLALGPEVLNIPLS